MTVAEAIRARRIELGITQHALAERVRCDRSHIANLEGARASPSWPLLRAIAVALGLDLGALTDPADPAPTDR